MNAPWSQQQDAALKAVSAWLRDPGSPQVFRLFGFAGTGKTTLARQIAADANRSVQFAAFTGKAASVLRSKGCDDARTLHSLCYRLRDNFEGNAVFERNDSSDLLGTGLLILDECSMVSAELGQDVLSFGTKVLVLGDPMQLPPINGEGFFDGEADVMLTDVRRQARDNPIIQMATTVREGGRLQCGRYGQSRVLASDRDLDEVDLMIADQLLVGRNATRVSANNRLRKLHCFDGVAPTYGEKLVCLKNNRDRGLLNGGLWSVEEVLSRTTASVQMRLLPDVGFGSIKVRVPIQFFQGTEDKLDWQTKKYADQFGFGYALTIHKSQGSQWNDVVLFDESQYFREHRARHLYTGLTRAARKVTVVQ